jgi:hypothetical protein
MVNFILPLKHDPEVVGATVKSQLSVKITKVNGLPVW